MDKRIRVACLGAGYFSRFHYDAWRRIEEVELVGAADLEPANTANTGPQGFTDLQSMLKATQPDVLDIITPPGTHLSAISAAVEFGVKTVICQKPFCQSLGQARNAAVMAAKSGSTLVVHENFRFQPWFRAIAASIQAGDIGAVQQATFRLRTGDGQGPDAYLDRQPYFQTMRQLLVHETAVHYIDTFEFLFGHATAVYADLRRLNPAINGEDAGYIVFDFPNGMRALFDGNRHLDHAAENLRLTFGEALVEGTAGSLTLAGDGTVSLRRFGDSSCSTLMEPCAWTGFAGDSVLALQKHIVSHLCSGTRLENEAGEYLRILAIEQAVYQSAKLGCKIPIPE